MNRWVRLLEQFLGDLRKDGIFRADGDIQQAARRFLTLYQGALAMWIASGDLSYIRGLKRELTGVVDSLRAD